VRISINGTDLATLEDLTEKEIAAIFPEGVLRVTSRNPVYSAIIDNYGKFLEDRVVHKGLSLTSLEVKAYHYILLAVSQGILVNVAKES